MKLVLNGISFHNCPIRVRERLSLAEAQCKAALKKMHAEPAISDAVILTTCNRTEFYTCVKKDFNVAGFLASLIAELNPRTKTLWQKYGKQKTGPDAVRHLFEVAAGLDSQALGENQILAQLKAAYNQACRAHTAKFIFHKLFHTAFRAGKTVRTKTDINCGAVSISLAAVEMAKKKINLSKASAIVIGAGENAQLAAKYLKKAKPAHLYIANRSSQKAACLAKHLKAEALDLKLLPQTLPETAVVIASTASEKPILTYAHAKPYLAGRTKPLLIIDIAVPRDIDPKINRFKSVSICNIDHLKDRIDKNRKKRLRQIPKAREIVDDFTEKFIKWYDSLTLVPFITRLTDHGFALAHAEAKRYAKDFGPEQSEKLQAFAESLVKKILHGPITLLRNTDAEPDAEQLKAAELITRMFLSKEKDSR